MLLNLSHTVHVILIMDTINSDLFINKNFLKRIRCYYSEPVYYPHEIEFKILGDPVVWVALEEIFLKDVERWMVYYMYCT